MLGKMRRSRKGQVSSPLDNAQMEYTCDIQNRRPTEAEVVFLNRRLMRSMLMKRSSRRRRRMKVSTSEHGWKDALPIESRRRLITTNCDRLRTCALSPCRIFCCDPLARPPFNPSKQQRWTFRGEVGRDSARPEQT